MLPQCSNAQATAGEPAVARGIPACRRRVHRINAAVTESGRTSARVLSHGVLDEIEVFRSRARRCASPLCAPRRRRPRSSGGTRWAARSANGSTTWPRASTTARRNTRSCRPSRAATPSRMTAGIAAFRAGNAPAHPPGVRGRHRHDDGEQGRHRAGRQGHEGRGPEVRPERLRPGRRRLLHGAERPDAELARSTARRRSSTTTRTPSRPPASIRKSRPRPGPRSRWPRPS